MPIQRRCRLLVGLVLLIAMLVAGCSREAPGGAAPEAAKVSVMHPEQRELADYLPFNGWMQPDLVQEVRSRVRGHIKKVNFTDGMIVNKGMLLFEIDTRPFKVALDAAKSLVAAADADLALARTEFARSSKLAGMGAAKQEEVDVWTAKQGVAIAQKARAETEVEKANLDLEYCHITADIKGRIGKAELTEGNLVNAGGSDPLLTTIVSTDPIRVYFNIDERALQEYARGVKAQGRNMTELLSALGASRDQLLGRAVGALGVLSPEAAASLVPQVAVSLGVARIDPVTAEFTFALEGENDFKHKGKLAFSDNRIDPSTGTIQFYGTLPNEQGFFLAGARVRVRLSVGKPSQRNLVPETAILADQEKRYVLIADEKNIVRRRNVELGLLTDDSMRVIKPLDKLPEGEKPEDWWVITDNLQRARINYPVEPQKPTSK